MPEYEIRCWDESNFDVNIVPYTREAADAKKWAFVSDYARFWVLYHYGGVYFDTDVELVKPMDDIIGNGAFCGYRMRQCVGNILIYPNTYFCPPLLKDSVNKNLGQ